MSILTFGCYYCITVKDIIQELVIFMKKKPTLLRGCKIPLVFSFLSGMTIMALSEMDSNDQNSKIHTVSLKSYIIADNDNDVRRHKPQESSSGRQNNSAEENKRDTDDYEPQCDTPVWAMCTKRKKNHNDD